MAEQSEVDESRIDIGINISARSPGDCPQLIEIDPLLGLKATERVPTRVPGALSPFQVKQQNPLITDAYLQQQRALAETHGYAVVLKALCISARQQDNSWFLVKVN